MNQVRVPDPAGVPLWHAAAVTILIVDDDADDRLLLGDAFVESGLLNPLRFAADGEELMACLQECISVADDAVCPMPGIILLDLNMPRKDGREALREIKSNPALKRIPVIIFTTSRAPNDILRCYQDGANAYISKPGGYRALLEMVEHIGQYWLRSVCLPVEQAC